jgi:hypothetical protein
VRLADRTPAARGGKRPLTARAVSPLAHILCAAPVFAPRGARPPACWAAPKATYPERVVTSAGSRCRTISAGRLTRKLGVARPFGASTGGASPPPSDRVLGHPKNAGAFFQKAAPPAFGSTGWGRCGLRFGALYGLVFPPVRYAYIRAGPDGDA